MPYADNDRVFHAPDDPDTRIWRYMDFTKFVALLESRKLFFARADQLGDRLEGSYSHVNPGLRSGWYGDENEYPGPDGWWEGMEVEYRKMVHRVFVSCWHMNDHESAPMWRLYLTSGEGIAVRSTFARLVRSLAKAPEPVYIGTVTYLDYSREPMPEGNTFFPFVHKRKSFEHEHELRAVIAQFPSDDQDEPPLGVAVEVGLDELIDSVYVAPEAPAWQHDLVAAICKRYDMSFDVRQSDLDIDPVF